MVAPLAKFMDWLAIQIVWGRRMACLLNGSRNSQHPRLEEALAFLKGPDFISVESEPAQVEFDSKLGAEFRFPSPRPCDFTENNTAYGRLYRREERWQKRPAIILLHGAGGDPDYHFGFPRIARLCNRAGFNAVTLMLPFQFQRRPRELERRVNWPDWMLMAVATFGQALAEIRAIIGWLLKEGCPVVALWGNSYGGQLAGILACRDVRIAAAVLTAPGVNMHVHTSVAKQMVWSRVRMELERQQPDREALNSTPLNLTTLRPCVRKENILLIEAIHDLFVEKKYVDELWEAWGQPDIWRLPHGHASKGLVRGLTTRVLEWLSPRLGRQSQLQSIATVAV
jgi:pimeloyl-ACP methyl ester carboxylesterase